VVYYVCKVKEREVTKMTENQKLKISFEITGCCVVNIPVNIKGKKAIQDFILERITHEELEQYVESWIDYNVNDLNIE
jgi:hypothetical protein